MCAEQQSVDGVVLALGACDVRQPLRRETGPLQGVGHHEVVEEGRVLLPYLVLLVYDTLFHCLIVSCTREGEGKRVESRGERVFLCCKKEFL